jgi:hypothetical protein
VTTHVRLGKTGPGSITASIYALVERGALLRPAHAAELRGTVVLEFLEAYPPTRIAFGAGEIQVSDAGEREGAADLVVRGALPDMVALIAAPLGGGLPKPTSAAGRAALARLADGRVDFDGSLGLARGLLALMTTAAPRGRRAARPPG